MQVSAVLSLHQAVCKQASCTTALLNCLSLQQVLGDMPAELLPLLLLLYSATMPAKNCPIACYLFSKPRVLRLACLMKASSKLRQDLT